MAQPLSIEDTFFRDVHYTVKAFSRTTGFVKALLDGYEISGIIGAKQDRIRRSPPAEMQRLIVALTVSEATVCSWTVNEDLMPGRMEQNSEAAPDGRRWNLRGRYACRTWAQSWDFSLRRRIGLTEKFKLQLQADIFNAFNRANFRDLESSLSNAAFGTLGTTGPPRNIQFGLKLTFWVYRASTGTARIPACDTSRERARERHARMCAVQ